MIEGHGTGPFRCLLRPRFRLLYLRKQTFPWPRLTSGFVKGSRTPAVAGSVPRTRSAGVREVFTVTAMRHIMMPVPKAVEHWSLTTLREKLMKTGAKVVRHGRYITFPMTEAANPSTLKNRIVSIGVHPIRSSDANLIGYCSEIKLFTGPSLLFNQYFQIHTYRYCS